MPVPHTKRKYNLLKIHYNALPPVLFRRSEESPRNPDGGKSAPRLLQLLLDRAPVLLPQSLHVVQDLGAAEAVGALAT